MLEVEVFLKGSGAAEVSGYLVAEDYQDHGYSLVYKSYDAPTYRAFFPWANLGMIRYYEEEPLNEKPF